MEKITPFDIPLLNKEICHYLTLKDIVRCVQVSKAWADWFSPALWRDLDCHIRLPYVYVHTFKRQQEHVRIMRNITTKQARSVLSQVPCKCLQRLEFIQDESYEDVRHAQIPVLRLLKKIPTLRHLQIVIALDHDNTYRHWIRTLEALPHLESLSLKCDRLVSGKVIQQVLLSSRGLQCLSPDFQGYRYGLQKKGSQEYEDAKAVIETMPEMRLRELSFNTSLNICLKNILPPLLERCPRMEKLYLGRKHRTLALQDLAKPLKENKLPKLRHLSKVGSYKDDSMEVLEEALSHIACGLESFELQLHDGSAFVQPLVRYHSHSLTKLDLDQVSLSSFFDFMAGLSCLRVVTIAATHENEFSFGDIVLGKNWECLDLRTLRLSLRHTISFQQRIMDYVFSEVAKLASLQELSIGTNHWNLYGMSYGYLERLASLKNLEVFVLTKTPHDVLGKQEAQWMAENWRRLLQVHEKHASAIFKEALLKKRPLVEFVNG